MRKDRIGALLLASLLVAGCGGGGGGGASATPPANLDPVANAGPNQSVAAGAPVSLPGSGTDGDGTVAGYAWLQLSGTSVTLSNAGTATASFTAPSAASPSTLVFQLTVTDDDGATDTDTVTVTVSAIAGNQVPVANAGSDQSVAAGAAVSLPGSGTDADGTITGHAWVQLSGTPVSLAGASTPTASFTAPTSASPATLVFQLTVTDDDGASDTDTVTVNVAAVALPDVEVSGAVTFDRVPHDSSHGLDYAATTAQPVRGATVQAVAASNGAILASSTTDAAGAYALMVPANTTLRIRVRAEMIREGSAPNWDFEVVDNTDGDALYVLEGSNAGSGTSNSIRNLHAASGWGGSEYTGTRAAAPFAILDSIYTAFTTVLAAEPDLVFPPLTIKWSTRNQPAQGTGICPANGRVGTSFYFDDVICILGSADNDTDEYDGHLIIHEWGHYYEDNFSRSDSLGGAHTLGDRLDLRVAFSEGFATALSGIATGDPVYEDSSGDDQAGGFEIDVEDNVAPGTEGWFNEDSVQSIVYDLADATADGDGDTLALGWAPLHSVLRNQQRTTDALTSIFPFVAALRADLPGSAAAIGALAAARGVNGSDEFATGESNSGSAANVLPVYTTLALNGGAEQVCSIKTYGEYNKLSNRRFLRFTLGSTTTVNFTATGGSDPDLLVWRTGVVQNTGSNGQGSSNESFSETLDAGTYVLEVYEFQNVDDGVGGGLSCIDVSISG